MLEEEDWVIPHRGGPRSKKQKGRVVTRTFLWSFFMSDHQPHMSVSSVQRQRQHQLVGERERITQVTRRTRSFSSEVTFL